MSMHGGGGGGGGGRGMISSFSKDEDIKGHQLSPGTWGRVLSYARPYTKLLIGFVGILVLSALMVAATPILLQRLVDDGVSGGDEGLVILLASLVAVVALAEAGLGLVQRWFSSRIGESLIFDLRTDVFAHVQRQSVAFFTRSQTGALVSRLNSDVVGAQQAFTSTLSGVVSNVISVVVVLATMFVLSWQITIVALLIVPFLLLPARRVGRRLAGLRRRGMELNASLGTRMTERFNVAGALLVKLYGDAEREDAEFAATASKVRDNGIRTAMSSRMFFAAMGAMASLATALVYGVGGVLAIRDVVTVGTLIAFAALLGRLYGPISALTSVQVDVMSALVSFDRVFEVLDLQPAVTDKEDAVELPDGPLGVTFDEVRFAYPAAGDVTLVSLDARVGEATGEDQTRGRSGEVETVADGALPDAEARLALEPRGLRTGYELGVSAADAAAARAAGTTPEGTSGEAVLAAAERAADETPGAPAAWVADGEEVLRGVSVDVAPGSVLAIVGPSGAGKTTLSTLVTRLYDVTGGAVRVGGVDVRDVTQQSLRSAVGVVTQDAHLFHDSLGANLRYARPQATDAELLGALRAAQLGTLLDRLPEGLETVVGDRGHRLSGGEKQRVAIARLLLRSPRVVVLDEATAHLDSESESAVQRALDTAMEGRTSLVIAHRLSTVRQADQILVLDAGQVAELGTHDQLLAAGGLYALLHATQFAGDPGEPADRD